MDEKKVLLRPGKKAKFMQPSETQTKTGTITCILEAGDGSNGELYAFTAGHCVKEGDACIRKKQEIGKCIYSLDNVTNTNTNGEHGKTEWKSVDVGLIKLSEHAKDLVQKHFKVNKKTKTQVKVRNPTTDDVVHLLQLGRKPKLPTLEVSNIDEKIKIRDSGHEVGHYYGTFYLRNPIFGEGSGIVGGDSGTCVLLDKCPGEVLEEISDEKAVVLGMVVAYYINNGDAERVEAVTTAQYDDERRGDVNSFGVALPMKRLIECVSKETDIPLKLCGLVEIPHTVDQSVAEDESVQDQTPNTIKNDPKTDDVIL